MGEYYRGWYDFNTGQVHCLDKQVCLHELVHKFDWESKDYQISESQEFKSAVAYYYTGLLDKKNLTWFENYVLTFPGVGGEYLDYGVGGWGGFNELYAEIFAVTTYYNIEMPKEFEPFYDRDIIIDMWNKYPNIKSRL